MGNEPTYTQTFGTGAGIMKVVINGVEKLCFVLPLDNIKNIDPNFPATEDSLPSAEQMTVGTVGLAANFLTTESRDADTFNPASPNNRTVAFATFDETLNANVATRNGVLVLRKSLTLQLDEALPGASNIFPSKY